MTAVTLQLLVLVVGWIFVYSVTHQEIAEGVSEIIIDSNERVLTTAATAIGDMPEGFDGDHPRWEAVQTIIEQLEMAAGGFACIVDGEGFIVCHPEIRDQPGLREVDLSKDMLQIVGDTGGPDSIELATLDRGELRSGFIDFGFDGRHFISVRTLGNTSCKLLVHQPVSGLTSAAKHLTNSTIRWIVLVGAATIGLTILIAFGLARRGRRVQAETQRRHELALRFADRHAAGVSAIDVIEDHCKAVASITGVDLVAVCRIAKGQCREADIVSGWHVDRPMRDVRYPLDGTPCHDTLEDGFFVLSSGVVEAYPEDQMLRDLGMDFYAGLIFRDSSGEVVGWTVALHSEPVEEVAELEAALRILGVRSASELDRADHEEELRRAAEEAAAANRSKGEFLATISHEMRTPMTAIIGFTEEAQSHLKEIEGPDLSDIEESIGVVLGSSRFMLALVNDVLDLSKIEGGELALESIEFDLHSLVSEAIEQVRGLATGEVELELDCDLEPGLTLVGDPTRLMQIALNFLSNAVKFTERGHVRLSVGYSQSAKELRLSVADTGIGMSPEVLARISEFRPFRQADSSTTRRFGGTGLGLSISARLTEAMGGTIECSSVEGEGSEFRVVIPAESVATPETAPSLIGAEEAATSLDGVRVLLAEDNPVNQRLFSRYLTRSGCELDVASNGVEVLERLEAAAPGAGYDIILMDIQMPTMGGIEATEAVRAMGVTVPIAALTANAMREDREAAEQAGCNAYLTKPISRATLIAECARLVRTSAPADAA